MRRCLAVIALTSAATAGSAAAGTIVSGGNVVDQTWTAAGSPYLVLGDITVPTGSVLRIQAGTVVQFAATDGQLGGHDSARVELMVRGSIEITGTALQPVQFSGASTTPGSWYGIVMEASTGAPIRTIHHLSISQPLIGIHHLSPSAIISTAAVTLSSVGQTGVRVEAGAPTYDGIATSGGAYGFEITNTASATFTNCIARNTTRAGAAFVSSSTGQRLTLTNCSLDDNGTYGVYSSAAAAGSVTITNSIITSSRWGVYRDDLAAVSVTYSDVWNHAISDFTGGASPGTGTISQDPQFIAATDLRLQSTSVCIDAGTATGAPAQDIRLAIRPLDGDGLDGSQFDMGAYELALIPCGDGVVGPGETCDSGPQNGMYDACNATCTGLGPRCGDGAVNGPEACDDGNTADTDACVGACQLATCGDGFVRTGLEQCDDGNSSDSDGCVGACQLATCGDGITYVGVEQCDDGNSSNTDACVMGCRAARCGDGLVQTGVEACDDGNSGNTDGCVGACQLARCGDGFVRAGQEECDDANQVTTDWCLNTCVVATCGDGVIHAGLEQCDDGNQVASDACTASCQTAVCGDGVIRAGLEQCDDGNQVASDACTASCQTAVCGDGITQIGVEECDDGNAVDADACLASCTTARCGDGVVQAGVEECDDGNQVEIDACRNSCRAARCGDGVTEAGVEECDDANPDNGDGCSAGCTVERPIQPDGGTDADSDPGTGDGGCCSTGDRGRDTSALTGAIVMLAMLRWRRRRRAA